MQEVVALPTPDSDDSAAEMRSEAPGRYSVDELLEVVVYRKASDLHITAGSPPAIGPNETLVFVVDLVGPTAG